MTAQEAASNPFDPFDVTKVWPHSSTPLNQVGRMVLNRNPENYFAEVEQLAFNPANMVPGIEASPDKMLQGRLFSYGDTQRYRLGVNYQHIPVNCPYAAASRGNTYQSDGLMAVDGNHGGAPNYFPNSIGGPEVSESDAPGDTSDEVSGDVKRYETVCNFKDETLYDAGFLLVLLGR